MTDNIHSITPSRKVKSATGQKSVIIFHGDNWGVRFAETKPRLMMGQKTMDQLVEATESKLIARAVAPVPDSGPQQERNTLIAMLQLNDETVTRIDNNARLLGLSFAQAVAGELVQ
jgi:hypothetical protein